MGRHADPDHQYSRITDSDWFEPDWTLANAASPNVAHVVSKSGPGWCIQNPKVQEGEGSVPRVGSHLEDRPSSRRQRASNVASAVSSLTVVLVGRYHMSVYQVLPHYTIIRCLLRIMSCTIRLLVSGGTTQEYSCWGVAVEGYCHSRLSRSEFRPGDGYRPVLAQ